MLKHSKELTRRRRAAQVINTNNSTKRHRAVYTIHTQHKTKKFGQTSTHHASYTYLYTLDTHLRPKGTLLGSPT